MPLSPYTFISFESRMALPMQRMLEKKGATAIQAPSMQEVPLENHEHIIKFYEELKSGQYDIFILLTGVATRTFIDILSKKFPKEEVLETLKTKTKICIRGPKPKAVCQIHKIPISYEAPEPNTWREIITTLQKETSLKNKSLAILEYGIPNQDLIQSLKEQSQALQTVSVYNWKLPDDCQALKEGIKKIINNEIDLALFTSANQIVNVMQIVQEMDVEILFRRAFYRTAIASIGPICSERLNEYQFDVDYEVFPNKIQDFVEGLSQKAPQLIEQKRLSAQKKWIRVKENTFPKDKAKQITESSDFMKACRLEKTDKIPLWFMRQAGRYMSEYQALRSKKDFLSFCKDPELASEATISALERLGVDAAIIFSDILPIVEPMGLKLDYLEGKGPVIFNPIRTKNDINQLKDFQCQEALSFLSQALQLTRSKIHPRIPLLGFAACPFTLASYMIEGGSSKNFKKTKTLMQDDPQAWDKLLSKITNDTISYLKMQVSSGADALQIFDSWACHLSSEEYKKFALPYSQKIIQDIQQLCPLIHFGSFNNELLPLQIESGAKILSLDWRLDLQKALEIIPDHIVIQGNLNPEFLFEDQTRLLKEVETLLSLVGNRPGFIFNLGHGIKPKTPVQNVIDVVDFVHEWSAS